MAPTVQEKQNEHSTYAWIEGQEESRMGILSWIVVGIIAGALGKAIMPGDDPGGLGMTVLIGMAGALVGGSWWAYLGAPGQPDSTYGRS